MTLIPPSSPEAAGSRGTSAGPWRDGTRLVVRAGMAMPLRCAMCSAPVLDPPLRMKFAGDRGGGLIGSVLSSAWDTATGQIYTGPVEVEMPLCIGHRRRRRVVWIIISAVIVLFGGWAAALAIFDRRTNPNIPALLALPGVAAFVGLWVLVGKAEIWFGPKRFVGPFVWLTGSTSLYLSTLPQLDPAMINEWVAAYQTTNR